MAGAGARAGTGTGTAPVAPVADSARPPDEHLHGEGSARERSLPAHVLLLVVVLAAAVVRQGAFYADGQRLIGPLLAVAVVGALVTRGGAGNDVRFGPVAWSMALAAWAVASGLLAHHVGAARAPVALLAAVVGVLVVSRRTEAHEREALAVAALAVGVLCAMSGWVGVAWRISPLSLQDQGLWRAASSLTYANATAGLLVPLALVALAWSVGRPGTPLPAMVTCVLLLGTMATLSRGGAVALVAGGLVLAGLLSPRRVVRAAVAPVLGAGVAFAGLVPSIPATSAPRPALAVLGLLGGLAVTVAMTWLPSPAPLAARAAVLAGIVILGAPFAGQVGRGLSDIRAPRLSASSPDRGQETAAAIRLVREHPVAGTGPGRAVLAWAGPDGGARFAHYVHDEYLQVLVELGAVGLALLASLLVAGGLALRGARTRASHPELWAGAVAGLAALAVHSAFDFLWHLAVIPMLAALLVGIVCPIALEETS